MAGPRHSTLYTRPYSDSNIDFVTISQGWNFYVHGLHVRYTVAIQGLGLSYRGARAEWSSYMTKNMMHRIELEILAQVQINT